MQEASDLVSRVVNFIRERDISPKDFAELLGVPQRLLAGILEPNWDPRASTLDLCLAYVDDVAPGDIDQDQAVEYELPRELLERDHNRSLLECASIWTTIGRARLHDVLEILRRHEMSGRVALNRLGDNHRIYMDRFNPRTWGDPCSFEGVPVSELPDKRFGRWAEKSIAKDYLLNRPRLIACRVPMETAFGKFIVPYTALRLPCGKMDGVPENIITITRLEPSPYKVAQESGPDHPSPRPPSPGRSGHLRLVKS